MGLSYIVTMIMQVMKDLRVFFLFFSVLIFLFSLIFDIVAVNENNDYREIGAFAGTLLGTLRLSMGDTDFNFLLDEHLDASQH